VDVITNNSLRMMERSIEFLWVKQNALLDNISNVETPNYKTKLVTFEESDYNQNDATGFINLWGLPDTVQALREQGKL